MKPEYKTLDDYLDALDSIKETVAEETEGMTAQEVKAYFARARPTLQRATGETLRVRRPTRQVATAKR